VGNGWNKMLVDVRSAVMTAERITVDALKSSMRKTICEPCFELMLSTNEQTLLCRRCQEICTRGSC
jgi:tRNA(Ile2) C34 agmatinyltransferase TiaS